MGFIYTNFLIPELQRFPFLHRMKVITSFFLIKCPFLVGKLWLVYSPIWWKVEGVPYPTRLHIDTAAFNSRPGSPLSWSNKGKSHNWPGKSLSVHFPDQLSIKRGWNSASRWQCAQAKWILKTVVLSKVRLGVLTLGTGANGCCLPLCGTQPGIDMNVQTVSASH